MVNRAQVDLDLTYGLRVILRGCGGKGQTTCRSTGASALRTALLMDKVRERILVEPIVNPYALKPLMLSLRGVAGA